MNIAIADPPYFGCAVKHYGDHPDAAVYDTLDGHRDLISRLMDEYDGWALAMTSGNLHDILPLCPPSTRIAAWCKSFASFKPNVSPAYAWEPVVFIPARKASRTDATPRDFLVEPITLRKGLTGAKPRSWTLWVLDLLGADRNDCIDDLFPGSGAVRDAIDAWRASRPLPFEEMS